MCSVDSISSSQPKVPCCTSQYYKEPNCKTNSLSITTTSHKYIPLIEEPFTKIKQTVPKELITSNPVLLKDVKQSLYQDSFDAKRWNPSELRYSKSYSSSEILYLRDSQEKCFRNPPKPLSLYLSTKKSCFTNPSLTAKKQEPLISFPDSNCKLYNLGINLQPPFPPEEKGFAKLMDPYFTTSRQYHVPFTSTQWNGIGKKDVLTFYDFSGVSKCLGFGVRDPPLVGSMFPVKVDPICDKKPFARTGKYIRIPTKVKPVPHKGFTTETQSKYTSPILSSNYYTDIYKSPLEYGEFWQEPSVGQTMSAPGMYHTENCHYGTGWPVSMVVDQYTKPNFVHESDCLKVI